MKTELKISGLTIARTGWLAPQCGSSFIELLVAVAIMTTIATILFHFVAFGHRVARDQPELADALQRLRVAADALQRDLAAAGAGVAHGESSGSLTNYVAPIVPARVGARDADPELTAFPDRMTLITVPANGWEASLATDMRSASDAVPIAMAGAFCPPGGMCGFTSGSRVLLLDTSGLAAGHELFNVTGLAAGLVHGPPNPPFTRAFSASTARAVPVRQRVYYLDRSTRRLMLYDGHASDVPLVDHVLDLQFAYYVDGSPASVVSPAAGRSNCAYAAGSPPIPLLADLGGPALRAIAIGELADGPACGLAPHRFDADLLRIRRVRVSIRVQTVDGRRPLEVTFEVAPRNLTPGSSS